MVPFCQKTPKGHPSNLLFLKPDKSNNQSFFRCRCVDAAHLNFCKHIHRYLFWFIYIVFSWEAHSVLVLPLGISLPVWLGLDPHFQCPALSGSTLMRPRDAFLMAGSLLQSFCQSGQIFNPVFHLTCQIKFGVWNPFPGSREVAGTYRARAKRRSDRKWDHSISLIAWSPKKSKKKVK